MIKITADSTCDLSPDILNGMDITLIPLCVLVNEEIFRDGVDIKPADLFRYVDKEGKSCRTTAINTYEYECFFEEFSSKYEAVVHICIGSGFSSCYQNAALAAESFRNVYVIDSQNLSSGSGHLVYEAASMAGAGANAEDICRSLQALVPKVDASFVIDRLDYLYKGGRCSGLELLGSKVLHIKPCIEVVGGKMTVGKKYMGSFESSLRQYVHDRLADARDIDFSRVFITHPMCAKQTVDMVKELLRDDGRFAEIIETPAGCTVSSHCGPDTLGILFKRSLNKAHGTGVN
ncbi:MAG TPA: DegV family protein [Feifaniaceae bacterium]|nr:DegV family protein [Feifaniaceae bacterium]